MPLKHELSLTNVDKIFWPAQGYTKGDVLEYYLMMADVVVNHVKNRPMVLNRHPNGINESSFFQKQIFVNQTPTWIKTARVQHSHKVTEYLMVQDLETLLYVANLGCIELNPFLSTIANLLNPSYMVIDLDPEDVPFDVVVEIALSVREILASVAVPAYCKTSGGRGLHIYVPLGAKYNFKQAQDFAHLVALIAEERHPKIISLERSPKKRPQQIYIDFLRNSFGQTLASAYCVRPKPYAPVSTPLEWSEVKTGLRPADFNIKNVPARLLAKGDLFEGVLYQEIDLEKALNLVKNKHLR